MQEKWRERRATVVCFSKYMYRLQFFLGLTCSASFTASTTTLGSTETDGGGDGGINLETFRGFVNFEPFTSDQVGVLHIQIRRYPPDPSV